MVRSVYYSKSSILHRTALGFKEIIGSKSLCLQLDLREFNEIYNESQSQISEDFSRINFLFGTWKKQFLVLFCHISELKEARKML